MAQPLTVGELIRNLSIYRPDLRVRVNMLVSDRDNPNNGNDFVQIETVRPKSDPNGHMFIALDIQQ